jgi:hypothetical protein
MARYRSLNRLDAGIAPLEDAMKMPVEPNHRNLKLGLRFVYNPSIDCRSRPFRG